jgi:ribonucleoside-diphosphate reductase alpha chain
VTINDVAHAQGRRPFEIFVNSKNMEHYAWTLGLTRMISAVFRRTRDVSFVVEELKAVFDPRGGAWMEGRYVPSLPAAIGGIIERHVGAREATESAVDPQVNVARAAPQSCPQCGAAALVKLEGCSCCTDCGFSKCA